VLSSQSWLRPMLRERREIGSTPVAAIGVASHRLTSLSKSSISLAGRYQPVAVSFSFLNTDHRKDRDENAEAHSLEELTFEGLDRVIEGDGKMLPGVDVPATAVRSGASSASLPNYDRYHHFVLGCVVVMLWRACRCCRR
jgi:hypothetical protein